MSMDALKAATNAGERSFDSMYFGQMKVSADFVALVKGVGKVPWNEEKHGLDKRVTMVKLMLQPLKESNLQFAVEREVIAESKVWAQIVWGSAKELGLTFAGDLDGKWVKAKLTRTGRTWEKDGETRHDTTLEFLDIYEDREACLNAHNDHYSKGEGSQENAPDNGPTSGQNGAGSQEKATALKFVEALVHQYKNDQDELAKQMADMPMIAKHFTIQSPEVQQLLAA